MRSEERNSRYNGREAGRRTLRQNGVQPSPEALAKAAARAADEKKASDVRVLEVAPLTVMAEYFVICHADTLVQVRAIVNAIEEALEKEGAARRQREWGRASGWVLLDYGTVIVHVFRRREREYYGLDRLWGDAREVDWRVDAPMGV